MATNEILQFAETDTGTNLLTQAEYLADSQRPIGNQPGVARSKLVNKALRQSSLIAAGIAEFLADNQANNITDSLTPQNIADYMIAVVRSLGIPTAVAGGTADAVTADFTTNVSLTNGTTVVVRAGSANTSVAPTFAPDGLTAKTIVKGNNIALAVGDIAGAGHWLELNFDSTLDKWVLQNPANGIVPGIGVGYMLLTDEKAQSTNGGSSVSGTQTRTLNTVRANTIAGASLASNQFTLPAGTYRIRARAPSEQTDNNRIYLTNVTDTTFPIMGSSEQGSTTGELIVTHATLVGRITITSPKVFEIRHYTGLAIANVGLGRMTGVAGVEVYTEVEIIKES